MEAILNNQSAKDFRQRKRLGLSFLKPPFRGGCLENLGDAPMGKGHNNEGKPFDVETACYLKPIFAAYDEAVRHVWRRKFVLKAGVKTMKSFTLEICAGDHCCHRNGDTAIYFGSGDVADDQSSTRIIDYYRGIPAFRAKVATLRSRFDETMGAMKFPDKTLRILPANLSNTQGLNLGFAGLCDAFVTEKSGMIDQLIARTTQYADAIVFLESQGGETAFDFDRHYEDTDQRELHVICPYCDSPHIFNWKVYDPAHMTRLEGFVPVAPKSVASMDRAAWIEQHRNILLAKDRRIAGFKRGTESEIKFADGHYNELAILRETHFECFHCGSRWEDTPEIREQLDRSSFYVASRTDALPENIGFNFPQWINRRLSWGKIMLEKLKASKTNEEHGQIEPLKIWWQKAAARTWDKAKIFQPETTISPGSYDPAGLVEQLIPDEHSRNMAVDCQEDGDHKAKTGVSITGWFWYIVRVFDKFGNSKQLARGYCKNEETWRAVQRHWKVPNDRVMIDSVQWSEQVIALTVKHRDTIKLDKPHPIFKTMDKTVTFKLLAASPGKSNFKGHRDGIIRAWSPEMPVYGNAIGDDGRVRRIPISRILFNKTPVQLQVDALYSGAGAARFESLAREHLKHPDGTPDRLTLEMETGMRTYANQMASQYYDPQANKYVELRPDDHYYWCEQALVVRVGMDGILGQVAVYQEA